jgi:ABC-type amino acid transport substrate-binding protein
MSESNGANIGVMRTLAAMALCASLAAACSDAPAPATRVRQQPPKGAAIPSTPAEEAREEIPEIDPVPAVPASSFPSVGLGDLDDISQRSYLRVLVAPEPLHFQTAGGQHSGRAVDAVDAFVAILNGTLTQPVSVAYIETAEDALVADLLAGKGDIAVNMRITLERDAQVQFASPVVKEISEVIVTGPASAGLVSLEDAGGRTIHVRRGSDHHASLLRLNEQLKQISRLPVRITVNAAQTDQDLLGLVSTGAIPATLVDDYLFDACCAEMRGLKVNRDITASQDGEIAWATRKDSPKLLEQINKFFAKYQLTF